MKRIRESVEVGLTDRLSVKRKRRRMDNTTRLINENAELKKRLANSVELSELIKISNKCFECVDCTLCDGMIICDHLRIKSLVDCLKEYIEARNEK